MRNFFCTCLLIFMKESVRAEQFLYVKHALQYMNGHAVIPGLATYFSFRFFKKGSCQLLAKVCA